MKRWLIAIALVCLFWPWCAPTPVWAQTVAPMMGLGSVQFFSDVTPITPLSLGVLYTYQAGTTTQAPTYTDSSGMTLNADPVVLDSSGRASIWLLPSTLYKFVLCTQNDGAQCSPGDTLFTQDNVPGVPTAPVSGAVFTGTFISGSPQPASTGILELATADTICWRNNANNANLCLSKNSNDLLSWSGGSILLPEQGIAPTGVPGYDLLWADGSHRFKFSNNGAAGDVVVGAATTDTFTNKTWDPVAGTGNSLLLNGVHVTGVTGTGSAVLATSPTLSSSTLTSATITSPTITTPTLTGGTIDNTPIGQTIPAPGTFTSLEVGSTGPAIAGIITKTLSFTFGSLADGVCTTPQTASFPGLQVDAYVDLNLTSAGATAGGTSLRSTAWAASAGVVTVQACNLATGTFPGATVTYNLFAIQH